MAVLLTPLLLIGAVLYIAWPLMKDEKVSREDQSAQALLEEAIEEKNEVISALKDIEMDYRMGKLSPDDYQNLKSDFEFRAVKLLKRIEEIQGKAKSSKKKS